VPRQPDYGHWTGTGPGRGLVRRWRRLFGFSSEDREGVGEFEALSDRIAALSQPYQAAVEAAARRHGLDEKLLHAVVIVESAYRPEACLIAGACGLTQLMPGTAADLQVPNRLEPEENVRGGVAYLAQQLVRFGDVRLALAAYNAGPPGWPGSDRSPTSPKPASTSRAFWAATSALTAGRRILTVQQCQPTGGSQW
jgi:soluble lytic murein transglycosylase-like protein